MTLQAEALFGNQRDEPGRERGRKLRNLLRSRALVVLSTCIALSSLLLAVFPPIDIAISDLAYNGTNFVFAKISEIVFIREMHKESLKYMLSLIALSIVVYAIRPRPVSILSPHRAIFVLSSFGIGALILVHALKPAIGRARPSDTLLFGGEKEFTPVWQLADMCGASCSFPSGESAAAAALLSFVVYFSRTGRWAFLAVALPLAAFLSMNRILVGAHYFSDVLLAWLMVLFVIVCLWRCIKPRAASIDESIWRAGEGARRFLYDRRTIAQRRFRLP